MNMVPLKGSGRSIPHGPQFDPRPPDPSKVVSVTVVLKGDRMEAAGAVEEYAHSHGIRTSAKAHGSSLCLTGTVDQFEGAFHVFLHDVKVPESAAGRRIMARAGDILIPEPLEPHVLAIMGFDQHPLAHPMTAYPSERRGIAPRCHFKESMTPVEVANLYEFPGTGGSGAVAIIELGGGYRDRDVADYLRTLGLEHPPKLRAIGVDGAENSPGVDDGADGEVQLDVEIVAAIAPGARIDAYFAPNTEQGFYDAIASAASNPETVAISISWGAAETNWTSAGAKAISEVIKDAALRGITTCVAAGDSGARDDTDELNVDFPASAPYALACGGTRLEAEGTKILREVVWNDKGGGSTGGGYSKWFAKPDYQVANKKANRGVPDVCGNADPQTGYLVSINGQQATIGGTSAVSPLWAALLALAYEVNGKKKAWANPLLYKDCKFRDIVTGDNRGFMAGTGWDSVTGMGSPIGQNVVDALKTSAKSEVK